MYNGKRILAIIPARSGSKGLKDKNIAIINSRPLIEWSIKAAKDSKYVDKIIVSTDSEKYKQIALMSGAEVPFLRPADISGDHSSRSEVIKHAIQYLENENEYYDYVLFLEPTSPLRTADDINNCIRILLNCDSAKSIVGISKHEGTHPDFSVKLVNNLIVPPVFDNTIVKRRQDLDDIYFYEGSVYLSEIDYYLENEFYHDRTLGYVVPRWKSYEIDEITDLVIIEALMKFKGYE